MPPVLVVAALAFGNWEGNRVPPKTGKLVSGFLLPLIWSFLNLWLCLASTHQKPKPHYHPLCVQSTPFQRNPPIDTSITSTPCFIVTCHLLPQPPCPRYGQQALHAQAPATWLHRVGDAESKGGLTTAPFSSTFFPFFFSSLWSQHS